MDLWNKLTSALSKERGQQASDLDLSAFRAPIRPAYEDVSVTLSAREVRHGLRIHDPQLEIDLHSALKGDPIIGVRPTEARGRRAPYSAMIELDNGNILIVRHRADDGDKLSVTSAREAKGEILSTAGKSFKVKLDQPLNEAFGVDARSKVVGILIVSLRLHPDDVARLRSDSAAEVVKALLLNPNQIVSREEIAKTKNMDVLVATVTGKVYRLRSDDSKHVVAESAFAKGKGENAEFLLRNESFHAGQQLKLCDPFEPLEKVTTSRILEIAIRRGDEVSDNYAHLERRFDALASPTTQEDIKVM